jgi:hypothetical protein
MIEKYVAGQSQKCEGYKQKLDILKQDLVEIRAQIRLIKRDLTGDNRLPSVSDIEYRLNLQKKIEFFSRKIEEFNGLKEKLGLLLPELIQVLSEKKSLMKNGYSADDIKKIKDFEYYFKLALQEFGYESKPMDTIKISTEDYLPLTQLETGEKYNIRFDSSASDFIRCLWAYYISLMQVSLKDGGNHPNLLMFDEPKQQDMSEDGFRTFLKKLSDFNSEQVLVFASFENKEESFYSATDGLSYNLICIEDKLIKPIA